MAFVIGCATVAIPVADAGNEVVMSFGSTSGDPALGGTLKTPRGVAVNATGAGGVAAGTVYVVDSGNNRVGRFSDSGSFVSTWGQDVVQDGASGDTGIGFEVCTVATSCKAGAAQLGQFAPAPLAGARGLAVNQSTGDVYVTAGSNRVEQFTATGAFVRAWGAGVVTGGATGTGTLANSTTTITNVVTTSKAFASGQTITGAGIQAGTTITATNGGMITLSKPTTASAAGTGVALTVAEGTGNVPTNEQQTITLGSNTTGGTFTLSYAVPSPSASTGTTAPIAYNAAAATVQTALEALANIGVGDVSVTGAAGGPWTVEFQGTRFADTDVNQLQANASGLTVSAGTGAAAAATTVIGASAAETCSVVTDCANPKSLSGGGQLFSTTALTQPAVGPSGNVYVPDPGNARVQEFSASGSFVRAWGWDVVKPADPSPGFEICTVATQCKAGIAGPGPGQFSAGHPTAVAVDSVGAVYAADGSNSRVQKFGSTGSYLSSFAPGGTSAPTTTGYNLAVDRSTDHVLVGSNFAPSSSRGVEEFDSGGVLQDTHVAGGLSDIGGIGVNPASGAFYVSVTTDDSRILMVGPDSPPEAVIAPATNVGATTATFNGTVTPPGGGLSARYRFEYSADGSNWTRFPLTDVDVGSTPAPVSVHQDVTGLAPNTHYFVRLVAATGSSAASVDTSSTVDFTTDMAPPLIVETDAADVTQTSANLQARIDPGNLATSYHFEWGQTASYGQRTPSFDPTISGSAVQAVQSTISGLQPDTAYHFRVVATNAVDTAEGPDRAFRTLNSGGLLGTRAYEIVSPPDKGPVARAGDEQAGVQLQVGADGEQVVWPIASDSKYLAARASDSWDSSELSSDEYRYLSRDLSCGVVASGDLLAPGAPSEVTDAGRDNLFRRGADGSHTVLTDLVPTNVASVDVDSQYASVSASTDCDHVVFATPFAYPGVGASGLYEWTGGPLRNAGIRPDGSVATGAVLGARGGQNAWNAVSDNGSRIFFSATSNDGNDAGKPALFVRKDGASTVKVSASTTATTNQGAVYQLASKSGSRVLFLANYGLTSTTSAGPTDGNCALSPPLRCDLYEYDVETGSLTDLSAHGAAGGAMVAGVLGASDDASHVYFAARGQLVPGEGRTATYNFEHGTYNVYLAHAGSRSFVGLLGNAEVVASSNRNGALVARSTADRSPWASRVTPDGRHLLFPSSAEVTGYDSGGVTEAYLYSADADEAVCVSCRRDGQSSAGAPAGDETSTVPLASDGSLSHHNPLHPPATLSDDGSRVFFAMPDVLATGAVSGRDNVYAWEDGQVYLLAPGSPTASAYPARFEGASTAGDDAFVSTMDALLPQDADGSLDIYAVRVDGGLPWKFVELPPVFPPAPPPATPQRAAFTFKGLRSKQRARLVAGKRVRLAVRVDRAGKVSVKGVATIKGSRKVVLAGTRRARGPGVVNIPVKLTKAARARIARAGSLKVSLTVAFAGAPKKILSITFKRPKPAPGRARRSA